MAKLKNSNCDKTKKNKLWQNLKDQIVTKLKNSNCAKLKKLNCENSKTQIVIVIKMTVVTEVVKMTSFSKNTLTPWQPTNSQGSFWQLLRCLNESEKIDICWNPLKLSTALLRSQFEIRIGSTVCHLSRVAYHMSKKNSFTFFFLF